MVTFQATRRRMLTSATAGGLIAGGRLHETELRVRGYVIRNLVGAARKDVVLGQRHLYCKVLAERDLNLSTARV